MPCGHGYPSKYQTCQTRQAHGQVIVEFDGGEVLPTAQLSDCLGSCGIASVEVVKEFTTLAIGECAAYKIKVVYDACYFAHGLPPLLQVSTCAPNEHNFDARVRNICDISNGQCAYFRVALRGSNENGCYPECAGAAQPQPAGNVAFNILASQGSECQ
jgi:hypothetical protein